MTKIEFRRLLDLYIAGFRPAQNFVDRNRRRGR